MYPSRFIPVPRAPAYTHGLVIPRMKFHLCSEQLGALSVWGLQESNTFLLPILGQHSLSGGITIGHSREAEGADLA